MVRALTSIYEEEFGSISLKRRNHCIKKGYGTSANKIKNNADILCREIIIPSTIITRVKTA